MRQRPGAGGWEKKLRRLGTLGQRKLEQMMKRKKLNEWPQNKGRKAQYILRRAPDFILPWDYSWFHPPLRLLLISPLNPLAEPTPMPSGLVSFPPCRERPASWPSETTPNAEQSLLANSRRDLSAADGHKELPRSRVVDASIRATLAPS